VLWNRELKRSPSPRVWVLCIIILLVGLGIQWLILVKSPGVNYPSIRQPKRTHVAGKELNKPNIGLQVELEISESSGCAPGETPGGHSQTTVFVQHGRVKADDP